jgi:hypothetical protein
VQFIIVRDNKECLLVRNHFADRHLVDKVEEERGQPIHSCVNHCVDEMSVSQMSELRKLLGQMSVGQMVFDQKMWNFRCIGTAHLKNCKIVSIPTFTLS